MPDVIIRVVNFLSPVLAGNVDVGHADFGGAQPKAVIVFGAEAEDSDTVETDGAVWSIGFAVNGGNTSVSNSQVLDNQATSSTNSRWRNNALIRASANMIGAVNSWVANGVRINFSAVQATQRRFTAVLIGGADVQVSTGTQDLGTASSPTLNITAPGFTPDIVLLHSCHANANNDTSAANARMQFGAATLDGTQRGWSFGDRTADTAASNPAAAIYDTNSILGLNLSSATPSYVGVINDFDAAGFSMAITGNTTNQRVAWLALKFAGVAVKLVDIVARTTTGVQAVTSPAFTPQAVIFAGTGQTAANTTAINTINSSSVYIGASDGTAHGAHTTTDDFAADPSNTKQLHGPHAIQQGNATDADAMHATITSFDTGVGFTLTYAAVTGTASLNWAVVFQVGDEPTPTITKPVVSQQALLVLSANDTNVRVSQHAMLVLGDRQPCGTKRAQLWKIARKDGEVFTFTGHDQPITYGVHVYSPCGSLNPSASQAVADLESVSNQELSGIISDEKISEADILAGLFDDAYVEVYLVSWEEVDAGVDSVRRIMAGWVGEISTGEKGFHMEVLGPGARLAQRGVTRVVSPSCDWDLGDDDCEVDVDALKLTGEVVSVSDDGFFRVSLTSHTSAAQYDMGYVLWVTGPNAGARTDIKSVDFQDDPEADILLWAPAPFMPEVGDEVEVFPGCDKTAATCLAVYDNKLNFGGFDQVPGNDDIVKTPDASY